MQIKVQQNLRRHRPQKLQQEFGLPVFLFPKEWQKVQLDPEMGEIDITKEDADPTAPRGNLGLGQW